MAIPDKLTKSIPDKNIINKLDFKDNTTKKTK